MRVQRNVALSSLTTLRLGGPAARLCAVRDELELVEAVRAADEARDEVLILGGGSNMLIADAGYSGLVVHVQSRGVEVRSEGASIELQVQAGEPWDELVARCVAEGWSGLEALSGIPGSVGATPIQNVGAYGAEVSDALVAVHAWDRRAKRLVRLEAAACALTYRDSMFKRSPWLVVTRVTFRLRLEAVSAPVRYAELARRLAVAQGSRAPLADVREAVLELRRSKGMVVDPRDPDSVSAGSFFTNPVLSSAELAALELRASCALAPGEQLPRFASGGRFKVPAAWLIERAGIARGYAEGRVGVSTKHALALVNRGGGTSAELLALAQEIAARVEARFGVRLVPEPVLVGLRW